MAALLDKPQTFRMGLPSPVLTVLIGQIYLDRCQHREAVSPVDSRDPTRFIKDACRRSHYIVRGYGKAFEQAQADTAVARRLTEAQDLVRNVVCLYRTAYPDDYEEPEEEENYEDLVTDEALAADDADNTDDEDSDSDCFDEDDLVASPALVSTMSYWQLFTGG